MLVEGCERSSRQQDQTTSFDFCYHYPSSSLISQCESYSVEREKETENSKEETTKQEEEEDIVKDEDEEDNKMDDLRSIGKSRIPKNLSFGRRRGRRRHHR